MPNPMAGGVSIFDGVAFIKSGTNVAIVGVHRLLRIPSLSLYLGKSVFVFLIIEEATYLDINTLCSVQFGSNLVSKKTKPNHKIKG